ncbi:PREDICTED: uncharacterized protein C1orf167 homolog, partial [Hipposideros armiger]|uniref:Uncharacterized protein C1orf167 homolog n=1 Tax=Hipposideros armiger TaxID=186990 RepID=A0A8B7R2U0_HIPAR
LSLEQRRFLKSLDVSLGSGHGRWVPMGQAERGGPAASASPGSVLHQEPWRVQTNLASPSPRLKDTAGRLMNSSFRQQSNLRPLGVLPQGRARECAIQQSNLSPREPSSAECGSGTSPHLWSDPQESFWPHVVPQGGSLPQGPLARPSSSLRRSRLQATDTPCRDFRPATGYAPLDRHTRPGPRSWRGLGSWTSRLIGEPLTLEDLSVPAQSQARASSQAAISQLLASVRRLEQEAARLRCWASQEPPGPLQQEPWTSDGQAVPAYPQPGQLELASWDERKRHPGDLRGTKDFPDTPGVQADLLDSQTNSKPTSRETTLKMLTGDFLDPEQGVLSAHPNKARNLGSLESKVTRRQLLSRCFRAWWQLVWRQRAAAAVVALSHRQLLCRGLQARRWTRWLREAQLEVAWGRHTQALLARSFHKWRKLTQQQKQGQPHIQAGPGPPPPRGGQGQGSSGRKAAVDPTQRSSPGSLRVEAKAQPIPSSTAPRPDGGRGIQILQALQQLAAFLLWCHQKEWARQERGIQGEASRAMLRTQRMGRPPQAWCSPAADAALVAPLDLQHQRAWLCRCFGAWQQLVKRQTRYRHHLADRQVGTLRMCLQQWVCMKQLRASDGLKVTQLSLCQQKAGNMALHSSAGGGAIVHGLGHCPQGLPQEQGQGSLQKACRRLALHRVLLLWRRRLSQHQQADSCFQFTQRQMLRRTLRAWRLRVWGSGNQSGNARITLAPEPLGHALGEEASLGCSVPHSSLGKASGVPALLETLWLNFLWAAGRRQQRQCLLLWQARAQQSRGAAKWHRHTLQRRILLGWSHWATAQGSLRELAARWAWDRSCRATLGLWRRRRELWQEAEQWARERGRRLVRDALRHWHSCWQRQQFLRGQYQRWVQVHLQGLRRAAFWGWQQAAARRRHMMARSEQLLLQSHFQAQGEAVRDAGMLWAQHPAFQDGLRRRAPGATFTARREGRVAAAQAREQRLAWACIARRQSHVQRRWVDRQRRRAWGQQAFVAWRVALGQHCEARQLAEERVRAQVQVALCWTLWVRESHLHRLSRAHAAWKLSARVLEVWAQSAAQGRAQQVTITQFQQAGPRRLLQTYWAQWRTALLRVWLQPGAEAQEASTAHPRPSAHLRHLPRLASRGHLLARMDAAAPWKQTRSYRPQATGPTLPSPTQHRSLSGQRKRKETSWAQSDRVPPLGLQWPGCASWAQGRPPTGPGWDCRSETSAIKGKGQVDKRWLGRKYLQRWRLETLFCRLQGSQQARRLAATWQHWVDAQGAEELAHTLHRQWHLRRTWRMWRQRVVQLRVARRLQQQGL